MSEEQMKWEVWTDEWTGKQWAVHSKEWCDTKYSFCSVHTPSKHPMTGFPRHMREDRYMMERVCPHDVGHPDPDHITYILSKLGREAARLESVHGCDGCCHGG